MVQGGPGGLPPLPALPFMPLQASSCLLLATVLGLPRWVVKSARLPYVATADAGTARCRAAGGGAGDQQAAHAVDEHRRFGPDAATTSSMSTCTALGRFWLLSQDWRVFAAKVSRIECSSPCEAAEQGARGKKDWFELVAGHHCQRSADPGQKEGSAPLVSKHSYSSLPQNRGERFWELLGPCHVATHSWGLESESGVRNERRDEALELVWTRAGAGRGRSRIPAGACRRASPRHER